MVVSTGWWDVYSTCFSVLNPWMVTANSCITSSYIILLIIYCIACIVYCIIYNWVSSRDSNIIWAIVLDNELVPFL